MKKTPNRFFRVLQSIGKILATDKQHPPKLWTAEFQKLREEQSVSEESGKNDQPAKLTKEHGVPNDRYFMDAQLDPVPTESNPHEGLAVEMDRFKQAKALEAQDQKTPSGRVYKASEHLKRLDNPNEAKNEARVDFLHYARNHLPDLNEDSTPPNFRAQLINRLQEMSHADKDAVEEEVVNRLVQTARDVVASADATRVETEGVKKELAPILTSSVCFPTEMKPTASGESLSSTEQFFMSLIGEESNPDRKIPDKLPAPLLGSFLDLSYGPAKDSSPLPFLVRDFPPRNLKELPAMLTIEKKTRKPRGPNKPKVVKSCNTDKYEIGSHPIYVSEDGQVVYQETSREKEGYGFWVLYQHGAFVEAKADRISLMTAHGLLYEGDLPVDG